MAREMTFRQSQEATAHPFPHWAGYWLVHLLLVLVVPAAATDYYVATSGDNDNPGTESQPWRTIQKAALTLQAGDTVFIRAGTYRERIQPLRSGTAGDVIRYQAYPGETVVIDGSTISLPADWGGLFDISGRAYLQVSGIEVRNAGPYLNSTGILVDDSSNIIIERCRTYNTTSSGIGVWGSSNVLINGNEVELACNDGEQECITVADTNGFEVRGNHVHHGGPGSNGGEGIDAKDGSANGVVIDNWVHDLARLGLYVDSWDAHTYNIDVSGNLVHDCSLGAAVAAEAGGLLEDVRIFNNVIYSNEWVGIEVAGWGEPVPAHPINNVTIINNTIIDNGISWGGCILIEDNPDVDTVVIRNNLCSQNLSFQIATEGAVSNLVIDHNLIDGFRGEEGEVYGSDYQTGAPLFIDRGAWDLHLRPGSPAIDTGDPTGAPGTDLDGTPRPRQSGWDIGAFEYPPAILTDDFESGDTSAWSLEVS
jgi:hypothetical protein